MSSRSSLSAIDYQMLQHLGRIRFATVEQLRHWCNVHERTINRRLAALQAERLVKAQQQVRPAIWCLSYAGAQLMQVSMPAGRRQASWSVMAHACHTNQIEIAQRAQQPGFRFLDRIALLKQGFNPAHGEHAATDDLGVSYFILLDDYAMQPNRIAHAWTRRHTPHQAHWKDMAGRAWRDVVHRFMIFTTDLLRIDSHRRYITTHHIPADIQHIRGLWR